MTSLIIEPRGFSGALRVPPSKSIAHRAVICAALAGNVASGPVHDSQDVCATQAALAEWQRATQRGAEARIDCRESASTLRFLIPLVWLSGTPAMFSGATGLLRRPMEPYARIAQAQGIAFSATESGIRTRGTLRAGHFELPGDVSSQFISGLLFALPVLVGDSVITLTSPLESAQYVQLTRDAQARHGVRSEWRSERELHIPGGQVYLSGQVPLEGDWSHAAFWLAAGLTGQIELLGLNPDSAQGDRAIVPLLTQMGWRISMRGGIVCTRPAHAAPMRDELVIDARNAPDLVPPLSVAACAARGSTRIIGAARLRWKESDRLRALRTELCAIGASVEETEDGLLIRGRGELRGGHCDAHGDHRIAMALAVASCLCREALVLSGSESVAKSNRNFWCEFAALGGQATEREVLS